MTYPKQKVIFVDVDGTLISKGGKLNVKLVEFLTCHKEKGFQLILWSARGESHAKEIAFVHSVTHLFSYIVSKPGYVVDDKGWRWTRFTKNIRSIGKDLV